MHATSSAGSTSLLEQYLRAQGMLLENEQQEETEATSKLCDSENKPQSASSLGHPATPAATTGPSTEQLTCSLSRLEHELSQARARPPLASLCNKHWPVRAPPQPQPDAKAQIGSTEAVIGKMVLGIPQGAGSSASGKLRSSTAALQQDFERLKAKHAAVLKQPIQHTRPFTPSSLPSYPHSPSATISKKSSQQLLQGHMQCRLTTAATHYSAPVAAAARHASTQLASTIFPAQVSHSLASSRDAAELQIHSDHTFATQIWQSSPATACDEMHPHNNVPAEPSRSQSRLQQAPGVLPTHSMHLSNLPQRQLQLLDTAASNSNGLTRHASIHGAANGFPQQHANLHLQTCIASAASSTACCPERRPAALGPDIYGRATRRSADHTSADHSTWAIVTRRHSAVDQSQDGSIHKAPGDFGQLLQGQHSMYHLPPTSTAHTNDTQKCAPQLVSVAVQTDVTGPITVCMQPAHKHATAAVGNASKRHTVDMPTLTGTSALPTMPSTHTVPTAAAQVVPYAATHDAGIAVQQQVQQLLQLLMSNPQLISVLTCSLQAAQAGASNNQKSMPEPQASAALLSPSAAMTSTGLRLISGSQQSLSSTASGTAKGLDQQLVPAGSDLTCAAISTPAPTQWSKHLPCPHRRQTPAQPAQCALQGPTLGYPTVQGTYPTVQGTGNALGVVYVPNMHQGLQGGNAVYMHACEALIQSSQSSHEQQPTQQQVQYLQQEKQHQQEAQQRIEQQLQQLVQQEWERRAQQQTLPPLPPLLAAKLQEHLARKAQRSSRASTPAFDSPLCDIKHTHSAASWQVVQHAGHMEGQRTGMYGDEAQHDYLPTAGLPDDCCVSMQHQGSVVSAGRQAIKTALCSIALSDSVSTSDDDGDDWPGCS